MTKFAAKIYNWYVSKITPCDNVVHALSQRCDRRLTLSEWFKVKLHLIACVWCTRYKNQLHLLRTGLKKQIKTASETNNPVNKLSPKNKSELKILLKDKFENN